MELASVFSVSFENIVAKSGNTVAALAGSRVLRLARVSKTEYTVHAGNSVHRHCHTHTLADLNQSGVPVEGSCDPRRVSLSHSHPFAPSHPLLYPWCKSFGERGGSVWLLDAGLGVRAFSSLHRSCIGLQLRIIPVPQCSVIPFSAFGCS